MAQQQNSSSSVAVRCLGRRLVSRCMLAMMIMTMIALLPLLAVAHEDDDDHDKPPAVPRPLVLVPPENALEVCGPETFNKVTRTFRSCASAFYEYKDPDADCCEGLAWYYGSNTTKPSANCYCDKATWERLAIGVSDRYDMPKAFKICLKYGYDVPFYEEYDGLCYGVRPDMHEVMELTFEEGPTTGVNLPSTANWFSRLGQDSMMMTATVTGIMSVFGFAILVWPVMFDAAHSAHGAFKSLRSPRNGNRQ